MIDQLIWEMTQVDAGSPQRIQHFFKVHSFARLIGLAEGLSVPKQQTLEAAAVVHDIGIGHCLSLYGQCSGPQQEHEGPPLARTLLQKVGFSREITDRVCYLVGHHHTYRGIDGPDYQILVEADFLVNLFEHGDTPETVASTLRTIFKTESGKRLCRDMFGITED